MSQPLSILDAASDAASAALENLDWPSLAFNAQTVLKEDETNPVAWSYLGIAYLHLGLEKNSKDLVEQGFNCHQTAITYGPDNIIALGNCALAFGRIEDFNSALRIVRKGTDLSPDTLKLWQLQSVFELKLRQIDDADRSIAHVFRLSPRPFTFIIPMNYLYIDEQPYPIKGEVGINIYQLEDDSYVCEETEYEVYGTGPSFKEAFADFSDYFDTLIEEYVNTKDPLDEGAQELAANLRNLIGGPVSAD